MYAGDYGVAITDAEGVYRFSGLAPDVELTLSFRKTGYSFEPPTVVLSAGQNAPVPETLSEDSGRESCRASETGGYLVSFIDYAAKLRNLATPAYAGSARTKIQKAERQSAKLTDAFAHVVTAASALPDTVFKCPAILGCNWSSLSKQSLAAVRSFSTLKNIVITASDELAKTPRLSARAQRLRNQALRIHSQGVRVIKRFPAGTQVCGPGE